MGMFFYDLNSSSSKIQRLKYSVRSKNASSEDHRAKVGIVNTVYSA